MWHELELLHNVPSLIEEENRERHRYFWEQERTTYLEWVYQSGPADAQNDTRTYYEPVLKALEPLIVCDTQS